MSIIFCHVPKTAGATFLGILRKMYGEDQVVVMASADDKIENKEVLAGHISIVDWERVYRPVPKVTILRDPVQRLISSYYFFKRSDFYIHNAPSRKIVEMVRENKIDIMEFAKLKVDGRFVYRYYTPLNYLLRFNLIGIQEDFNGFLNRFSKMFNKEIPKDYINENVNNKYKDKDGDYETDWVSSASLSLMLESEYEIYDAAKNLIESGIYDV